MTVSYSPTRQKTYDNLSDDQPGGKGVQLF